MGKAKILGFNVIVAFDVIWRETETAKKPTSVLWNVV